MILINLKESEKQVMSVHTEFKALHIEGSFPRVLSKGSPAHDSSYGIMHASEASIVQTEGGHSLCYLAR